MRKKNEQNEPPKRKASALLTMAILVLSVGILAQTQLGQQMASAADVCQNLQVSSTKASGVDGEHVPENTLDGDINNRWTTYGVGSWISYDLESSQTVCFVDIDWHMGQDRMYNLVISVSQDGASYTKVFSGKSSGTTALFERYDFADVSAKHVKLTINGNDDNQYASVSEVNIYGKNGSVIPTPSGEEITIVGVKASSNDGNVPENTIDNNLSTRWSSYGMGSWITLELSKSVLVHNVSIAWYNGAYRVNDFVVATSTDGIAFTNVFIGESSGVSTLREGYDTNDKTAKYVRVTVTGNSQNNWASITEIAVNGKHAYYEPKPVPPPTPTDTTPPTVAITFPVNGATVSGTIMGKASASDNVGVSTVAGFFDSSALNVETGATFQFAIDTTDYANGLHKFKVTATDKSGNKASHEISVNVYNGIVIPPPTPPTTDVTLPSISISNPSNGQSFSAGTTSVTVSGAASDNIGVTLVEKSLNGGPYSPTSGTTSWSFTASGLTNGQSYTATVRAKDANGNTKSAMVSFSVQSSTPIPPPPAGGDADKFGLKMLYPTKTTGEQWFMDMANPEGDSRFDPKEDISKNADGSWKMRSSQVRMNVFTSTGYDPDKITTYAQNQLATKGYMQSSNDWKNVEITGFVKVNSASDDNFAWYGRGGKHTDSNGGCEGTAYKVNLYYSGKVRYAKEQQHADGYSFTSSKTGTSSIMDRWVGFKGVIYNNAQGNVVLESWISEGDGAIWKKVDSHIDSGGWGSDGDMCGASKPDQKITWGGPIVTFRWDSASDVDFKWLSVREIQPPT
jgi:hypothetical protein